MNADHNSVVCSLPGVLLGSGRERDTNQLLADGSLSVHSNPYLHMIVSDVATATERGVFTHYAERYLGLSHSARVCTGLLQTAP